MAPRLLAGALLLVGLACASRLQGDVTYDTSVDFSRLQTFGFEPAKADRSDHRHAVAEITRILESRGRRPVALDEADARIDVKLGTRSKVRVSGRSTSGTEAGLVIEVVDASTGEMVWYGWASETWRESMDPEEEITKAVEYIFSLYPPPGG